MEAHHEDGPVGAIRFEVGDACRKYQKGGHDVAGDFSAAITGFSGLGQGP